MKSILVFALLMVACGGGASPIATPEGGSGFKVKCKTDRSDCMADAGESCGGPYYVISEDQHTGGLLADALPGPVTWWTVTVGCGRAPDGYVGSTRSNAPNTADSNPFASMTEPDQELTCRPQYGTDRLKCVPK